MNPFAVRYLHVRYTIEKKKNHCLPTDHRQQTAIMLIIAFPSIIELGYNDGIQYTMPQIPVDYITANFVHISAAKFEITK